jgi:hypothetical protein
MFKVSSRLLLFPDAAGGGDSGDDPPADDPPVAGDPPAGDPDPEDDEKSTSKDASKPKDKVRRKGKVAISAEKLQELQDKARKADEYERERVEAQTRKEQEQLQKEQATDPAAALTSLKRKYTNDTKKLREQIEQLESQNKTLIGEQANTLMGKSVEVILADTLKAAKLEPINDKVGPRMVKELMGLLEAERQADGTYEFFGKDDGSSAADVIKGHVISEFKDVFLKPKRSDPANSGDSRRDGGPAAGTNGKPAGWRDGFLKRKEAFEREAGVVPPVGLKPKSSS